MPSSGTSVFFVGDGREAGREGGGGEGEREEGRACLLKVGSDWVYEVQECGYVR